ncbi:agglutinin biogenesis protein MshP [Rhizobacter sp. SG703]|uniref:agglutinin biogenesis protein MshP n=1 Tax=Rhizobacter sp. SG703 TaxID=2587140 RepID=UPI0014472FB6|nr:agglutinin biogenesis protein MshP [Rhizobacter sp. SG703]NKI92759.1 MSHA biogenesis protein MshP [Rhizobacter sp. SG703]
MSTTRPERGAGRRTTHTGFTMVSVVFILVVLAALGAALASVSRQQHLAGAAELQSARAYQAARAGLEWWAYWQRKVGGATGACMATNSIVPGGNLAGFTVTLTCSRTPGTAPDTASDGATALTFWTVVANACNAPTNGICPATDAVGETYVERQLTWTLVR